MVKEVEGFMCSTDFEEELGEAAGGTRVFASEEELRREKPCIGKTLHACRVVKVRVRLVAEAVAP